MGEVLEIKMEPSGATPYRIGKARVHFALANPFSPRMLITHRRKKFWFDFKYERLPHYCYSCEKIGHYVFYCEDIPYDENNVSAAKECLFGSWLKVEAHECSPYWKLFCTKEQLVEMEEEFVPNTPINTGQLVLYNGGPYNSNQQPTSNALDKGKDILMKYLIIVPRFRGRALLGVRNRNPIPSTREIVKREPISDPVNIFN